MVFPVLDIIRDQMIRDKLPETTRPGRHIPLWTMRWVSRLGPVLRDALIGSTIRPVDVAVR